jgi:hypothetical protein
MGTKITDHYFEYGTVKYFRGKAENVEIGSYGEKKDPIGAQAWLEVQNKVKADYLDSRVKYITTTTIDWAQTNQSAVEVNGLLKYFVVNASVAVTGSYSTAKSAKLELAKFAIAEGPLKTMLNTDADGARNYMADEGSDARICSEVWVVLSAELSEHFRSSTSVTVGASASVGSLDITASGGSKGRQTITIAKGTTFAYLLHKVKDWNSGKTQIEDMEADYKGMN